MDRDVGYPCPCCGYLTLAEQPPDTYEICPVCNWLDDGTDMSSSDIAIGANAVSLIEARRNFSRFGAIDEASRGSVRRPVDDEIPPRADS